MYLGTTAQTNQIASTLPAVGTAVGGPIGGAVGTVLDVVNSIFGAKTHTTAGGETYKTAQSTFYSQQAQIETLYRQLAATTGITPPAFPATPPNHDGTQNIVWVTTLIGMYLNDPSLATSSSSALDTYKKNGTYDRALQAQSAVLQWLQQETAGSTGGLPVALVPTSQTTIAADGSVVSTAAVTPDYSSLLIYGGGAILLYLFFARD